MSMPSAVIGLSGVEANIGGTRFVSDRILRLDLPPTLSAKELDLMHNDLEGITAISRQHPEKTIAILKAASKHDFAAASKLANDIGLNEENLVKRGGGQVGVAVGILVVLVVAAALMSGDGGSQAEPVGQGGPTDAGADG